MGSDGKKTLIISIDACDDYNRETQTLKQLITCCPTHGQVLRWEWEKTSIRITKSGNNWSAPTHKCKVPQIGIMGSS